MENFIEVTYKEWWYKDKNDGYKSKGYFNPYNQLRVFERLFINYQSQMDLKPNSPILIPTLFI